MNAQPQAQQAPAAINQSGIAMGNMGPLTQQTQQPAPAPQGMQGLDPKLVAAMMAQFAKQKEAEMNQRQMALQAPQPQGTVVDQLLAQAHAPQAAGPAGIQQLMGAQRGNAPQPHAQGIDAAPAPQHFKEGGIVGFAEGGKAEEDDTAGGYYPRTGREGQRSFGEDFADAISASFGRAKEDAKRIFKKKQDSMDLPPRAAMENDPRRLDTAATWTGTVLSPQQLAAMKASNDPEAVAAAEAYERWAAQNPEQANAPSAAQGQGTPGGITAALPQPAPQYDAPSAAPRPQTPDYSALMAANNRQLGMDPAKERENEAARYRKEVGAPDTSATDAMLADYAERKKRLAPRDGIFDLLREYAKAPGQNWWQTGTAGGQSLADLNEKLAEQRDALSDKGFAAMQAKANVGRDFNKEAYGAGLKGQDLANAQLDKGVTAGTAMRNTDVTAGASMYHADQQLRAAKMQAEKAAAAGDKNAEREALAEIKATMTADQAFLASVQKKGFEATEVDKEDARRAARRIQEASAYLHAKRVPGAAVTAPVTTGGAQFVSPPPAGTVRP